MDYHLLKWVFYNNAIDILHSLLIDKILVDGEEMESGSGTTKEVAQAKAANRALKQLQSRQDSQ